MHRSLDFLRTLAEYRRLHIVVLLTRHHELSVSEITDMLHRRQTDVSHALADLRQARIVAGRRVRHKIYYSLSPDKRELVEQIIGALLRQFPLFLPRSETGRASDTPSRQGLHVYSPASDPEAADFLDKVAFASF